MAHRLVEDFRYIKEEKKNEMLKKQGNVYGKHLVDELGIGNYAMSGKIRRLRQIDMHSKDLVKWN